MKIYFYLLSEPANICEGRGWSRGSRLSPTHHSLPLGPPTPSFCRFVVTY